MTLRFCLVSVHLFNYTGNLHSNVRVSIYPGRRPITLVRVTWVSQILHDGSSSLVSRSMSLSNHENHSAPEQKAKDWARTGLIQVAGRLKTSKLQRFYVGTHLRTEIWVFKELRPCYKVELQNELNPDWILWICFVRSFGIDQGWVLISLRMVYNGS